MIFWSSASGETEAQRHKKAFAKWIAIYGVVRKRL
jgi:hypothetical protein